MAIGHIKGVARLTGFSCKKIYGCFTRIKKTGCNNEVTIRQGSTVNETLMKPPHWLKELGNW